MIESRQDPTGHVWLFAVSIPTPRGTRRTVWQGTSVEAARLIAQEQERRLHLPDADRDRRCCTSLRCGLV